MFRERVLHRSIDLGQRELTIGRGEQNDVVLDDPDKVVSRFHAELRPQNGGYVLVDLNSQNGTWMDDERVERVTMQPGIAVAIGPYQLVVERGADAP